MSASIGFLCIVVGCGGLGFLAFSRLNARVRLLSAFSMLAGRLCCEIGFRLTPLSELPGRLPALGPFWDRMAYTPYGEESFGEAWRRAANALDLPPIDRALLCEMGEVLGRYDAESQTAALLALRGQLDISLGNAREKLKASGRLYALAGVLGGLMLAVILL
ncbi:MAG: stage III sporulation protein AB [Oscillospiraceae bacterium]|nr:stage III sporulation protein AB [Oscillospiraceae bacterium]